MTLEDPETLRCYPGETRPDDWLTLPQFAAREGRQLVEQFTFPSSTEEWPAKAMKLRRRLDEDVLGGTEPRMRMISADVKVPGNRSPRKVVFSPERDVVLTAEVTEGEEERNHDSVLVLSCDGTDVDAVREYVDAVKESGRTAITLGLRATGDQAYERDAIGRAPDHNSAEWALLIGRPLLSQWVQDVRAAVTATQAGHQPEATVTVVGLGPAGIVAICAAAIDDHIDSVVTVGSLASYITEVPYENQRLGLMAPGILREVGDIPQLAALIAPRRLLVVGAVAGGGETLDATSLTDHFLPTQQLYQLFGEEDRLTLTTPIPATQVVQQWEE